MLVRLRTEPVTTVAAKYGYRDGSGADRVIKRLEEKANSDRALSPRLKALAKEVSRVDPDHESTIAPCIGRITLSSHRVQCPRRNTVQSFP